MQNLLGQESERIALQRLSAFAAGRMELSVGTTGSCDFFLAWGTIGRKSSLE
jgi:hypothetical protein